MAEAFTKTHRHRALDASSFSRVNPLRRRMDRRPLLESVFFAAAPSRAFFSSHSVDARRTGEDGSTPFWRKAGTSLFTYKSRAWRMRYAQAQFQLVKCASRRGSFARARSQLFNA